MQQIHGAWVENFHWKYIFFTIFEEELIYLKILPRPPSPLDILKSCPNGRTRPLALTIYPVRSKQLANQVMISFSHMSSCPCVSTSDGQLPWQILTFPKCGLNDVLLCLQEPVAELSDF